MGIVCHMSLVGTTGEQEGFSPHCCLLSPGFPLPSIPLHMVLQLETSALFPQTPKKQPSFYLLLKLSPFKLIMFPTYL